MERVYEGNLVEIFKVTPNVFFRKANLKVRGQCNGAFFHDSGIVGVLDAPTLDGAKEIQQESMQLFDERVSFVFLTHGHKDHWDGLPVFLDGDVTIFCSERLVDSLPASTSGRITVVGVRDRTRVRMGGLEVECQALDGTAHSAADMVVRVPSARLLCTGDLVVDFPVLYFHHANVENWIRSLARLCDLGDQYILPGHGDINPVSKVAECAEFLETLRRAGARLLSSLTAEEIKTMSEDKLNEIVDAWIWGSEPDVPRIRELAAESAARELRMVSRYLLYKELR